MYRGMTPRTITIAIVVLYFGGHMLNTGWESYKCERMLAHEDRRMAQVKSSNIPDPYNIKYRFNCKIPMYGFEWVYVEEDEDD